MLPPWLALPSLILIRYIKISARILRAEGRTNQRRISMLSIRRVLPKRAAANTTSSLSPTWAT